jgi:thiol-disulfide isomerase/thioredoxin
MKIPGLNLKSVVNYFKKINTKLVLIILVTVLLIYVLNYLLRKREGMNPNKEYVNSNNTGNPEPNDAVLYFFYADWCPHCTRAKEVGGPWHTFKSRHGEEVRKNNTVIDIKEVDCTDSKKDGVESMLKEYNVKGYPTILLVKNGNHYLYDTKPDADRIEEFIDKVV